jgi:uncharacterized protein HemX
MSVDEKETKAEQPAFDPNKLLRQLESLIQKKSVKLEDSHTPRRVSKSWYWAIILPVIVLAGIALVAWLSQRSNRELAKLRHEKNKTKILKDQAVVQAKIATNDEFIAEQKKIFNASQKRLRIIESDIAAEEKRHETDMHALHRIRTWDGSYRRMGG